MEHLSTRSCKFHTYSLLHYLPGYSNPPCEFREPGLPEAVEDFLMQKENHGKLFTYFKVAKNKFKDETPTKKNIFRWSNDQVACEGMPHLKIWCNKCWHFWQDPLATTSNKLLRGILGGVSWDFPFGTAWCEIEQLDQKNRLGKQFGSVVMYWNPALEGFHDFGHRVRLLMTYSLIWCL